MQVGFESNIASSEQGYPLRVALLSPLRYVLDGLANSLAADARVEVVASITLVPKSQSTVETVEPDVVVVSARRSNAPRLIAEIGAWSARSRIVVHGQEEDDEAEVMSWAIAGAHGFVPQRASDEELISVVRSVARGEVRYATSSAQSVVSALVRSARNANRSDAVSLLSRREREVFAMLTECSNKEIAFRLGVGVPTVKSHVHNILAKLGVPHRKDIHRFQDDRVK